MLIAEGGGGGTAWNSMSMHDMQRLIQNPDIEKHYDLVGGWQKSAELVNSHRFQVQSYRDNLAAAWPPKKSPASAAYLRRLDDLIAHLTETYNAALANHDALAAATLSLSLAQHDVQKLYDEYRANETLLQAFEAEKREASATPTPRPTPSPSGEEPPVPPGRQEQLRQQAAVLLGGVSTDLAQAQMSLVRPSQYAPARLVGDGSEPNDGSGFVPPPIPPISPIVRDAAESTTPSGRHSITLPPGTSPAPSLSSPPNQSTNPPGLVLGGTNPPSVTPTTPNTAISSEFPGSASAIIPGPSPIVPPGNAFIPEGNKAVAPPVIGKNTGFPSEEFGRPGSPSGGVSAMAPGGIFGGPPGVVLGQPAVSRPGVRRINPIGGIIGENRTYGTPLGSQGVTPNEHITSNGMPYGQIGGSRSSRQERKESHWDPNNPWETAEGVDPVVMPPSEQRVDPGPAIGLS